MTFDKSPDKIKTMFNLISDKYDMINTIMSFGTHKLVKKFCINHLNIKPDGNILDLCCGTGDLGGLIKQKYPKTVVTGVDFSDNMLDIAKDKFPNINYFKGDACKLPFNDNFFDIVVVGFGLRNVNTPEKAVEEIYRVLKPNGYFLHLDFGEKNIFSKIYDIIAKIVASMFSDNFFAYSYLIQSKKEFLTPDDLIKDFIKKGFVFKKRYDYLFKVISAQIMQKQC